MPNGWEMQDGQGSTERKRQAPDQMRPRAVLVSIHISRSLQDDWGMHTDLSRGWGLDGRVRVA